MSGLDESTACSDVPEVLSLGERRDTPMLGLPGTYPLLIPTINFENISRGIMLPLKVIHNITGFG